MIGRALQFIGLHKYLFGAFIAAVVIAYFVGRSHGWDAREAKYLDDVIETRKVEQESAGEAAQERETDTGNIQSQQQERDNAIDNAGDDTRPSAASNALNCERLRQAGTDISQLPACRGRAGGSEAGAGR